MLDRRTVSGLTRREALGRLGWLAGGAFAAPTLGALLAGCERGAPTAGFPAASHDVLTALVDHVIPATDTPGARDVGVPAFVEAVWAECFTDDGRATFLDGLASIDAAAEDAHGRPFAACSADLQGALVAHLDAEAFAPPTPGPVPDVEPAGERIEEGMGEPDTTVWIHGEPRRDARPAPVFWPTLKRLVLVGYYTSEAGATEELRYEAVPGRYDGCLPVAEVGRAWAA